MALSGWATAKPRRVENTLGQSKIMIAEPEKWNGRVLILAHGLRIEKEPLSADFEVDILPYKQLTLRPEFNATKWQARIE